LLTRSAIAISSSAALAVLLAGMAPVSAASLQDSSAAPAATVNPPVVRATVVNGTRGLSSSTVADVVAKVAFGKPGSPETIHAAVEAVVQEYRRRGFPVAEVTGTDLTPDGVLHLTVAEGTVRRILVKGNRKTRKSVILRAMETQPGSVYQEDAIKADRNRLARLGIFADVIIAPVAPGSVPEHDPPVEGDKTTSARDAARRGPGTSPEDNKTTGSDNNADPTAAPINPTPADPGANTTAPPLDAGRGSQEVQPVQPAAPAPVPASGDLAARAAENPPASLEEDGLGQVDVVIRVKEERTGNVAATVGYADGIGFTGFVDLTESNFQGAAQQVSLQWQRSANGYIDNNGNLVDDSSRQAFDVTFNQPLLGRKSFAYGVELYNKQTVFFPFFASYNDTIRNYETRRGATVRVGRSIGNNTALFLSARNDKVGYDPIPIDLAPPIDLLTDSRATVGALGLNLVVDGRNEADNPRHGYLHSFVYERAGSFIGGNRTFDQAQVDLREYFSLQHGEKTPIIATRLLGGTSFGSNAPLSEYYFLGGYDLLRGYNLYSIYGDRMILGSVELRAPVAEAVQGVLFVDCGNAYLPGQPIRNVRTGEGIGLRFLSPIGPIRLDIAHGSSSIQTYVSLGQSF